MTVASAAFAAALVICSQGPPPLAGPSDQPVVGGSAAPVVGGSAAVVSTESDRQPVQAAPKTKAAAFVFGFAPDAAVLSADRFGSTLNVAPWHLQWWEAAAVKITAGGSPIGPSYAPAMGDVQVISESQTRDLSTDEWPEEWEPMTGVADDLRGDVRSAGDVWYPPRGKTSGVLDWRPTSSELNDVLKTEYYDFVGQHELSAAAAGTAVYRVRQRFRLWYRTSGRKGDAEDYFESDLITAVAVTVGPGSPEQPRQLDEGAVDFVAAR